MFFAKHRLRAQKVPPYVDVVIAKPGGVLPAQGYNIRPDIASMLRDFFCHLRQIDRNVCVCEQTVRAMPLCTGTPGDIPDIIFTLPYNTDVVSMRG